jgi:hypothetical protein
MIKLFDGLKPVNKKGMIKRSDLCGGGIVVSVA